MALHVDWRNVENWEDLDDIEQQTVAFLLMLIGIDEITKKNFREVFRRAYMYYLLDTLPDTAMRFTLDDVRRYIGITTNVKPMTAAKWDRHLGRIARDRANRALQDREVEQQA